MVKTFKVYLSGIETADSTDSPVSDPASPTIVTKLCGRTYSCIHCQAHLARQEDLISKSFYGSQGQAYLFNQVVNVDTSGEEERRQLLTGLHSVVDIVCTSCHTVIGWKYQRAFEPGQKYKEGKFIVELIHLIKDNGWINS